MSDIEKVLREAMRAADAVAPDPTQFRFRRPQDRSARRRWTLVAAVTAAVCVIAVAILAVTLAHSGSNKRALAPAVPPPTLTCPANPPTHASRPATYPLPGPDKESLRLSDRLAPAAPPIHALACAYVSPASNRPHGNSARLIDNGLANIPSLMAWSPPAEDRGCTADLRATDGDLYLIGLVYPNGTLWISAPDDHCLGSSNGKFTAETHVATTVKSALDTGAWPKPTPPAPCTGTSGRLGQQQQMIPADPTSVTLCVLNGITTVREGNPTQLHTVTSALNGLPHTPDGGTFKCAAPSYSPAVSYTLNFAYAVGPAVTVTIFEPCTPAVHDESLQSADADPALPILSQILNNAPQTVASDGAPVPATSTHA